MIAAFGAGLLAASSLLLGAVIALSHRVRERTLGLIMAFGAGVLISAVAYDLVLEGVTVGGGTPVVLGLFAGAITFFAGDLVIDRAGGANRKSMTGRQQTDSPRAIVLGTVLDGIPESVVLGVSLLSGEGVSLAVLVAVFLSNLPEAMASTTGLRASGMASARIVEMWCLVVGASAAAAGIGYAALGSASPALIAFVQAFAAGAILTMLADTMMPEAFEHGGAVVGLVTTIGFALAFLIATAERTH
jgi:ZIP family zinc transporter